MILQHAFNQQPSLPSVPCITSMVFVIDEDISLRNSLESLIECESWQIEAFASAQEFLARPRPLVPSCLILALSHLDPNGLKMQKQIARERPEIPIIIVSSHGDIPTIVQAMKAGAVDFLMKPSRNDVLMLAIRQSLERSATALEHETELREVRNRYASLTPRERQVMQLVVSGLLNKQVGGELGISEITVKAHRGQVMHKMRASSLADLVRIASKIRPDGQAIHLA
ncbi:MAG TPA: LuxR C-terminal-related transcriptional regulator [Dongiaceae bacterium]|nr:LuxR C-terminal-related transcriptional regulator [Dongiaceae bacterium]